MNMTTIEILQLCYLLPSLVFMGIVGFLLIINISNGVPVFCNEFYPLVCYRIINDLVYHISMLLLLKFPMWGVLMNMYQEYKVLAQVGFLFGTATCCVPFIHALIISFIRFVAIYYPMEYKIIFTTKRIKEICIGMFICSFGIALPTVFFESSYVLKIDISSDKPAHLIPAYLTPTIIFYQMFYGIFLYGTAIVLAFVLNILNIIGLNRKKYNRNSRYSEKCYIIYCFFTLFTSMLMEVYFAFRISGTYFNNFTINHIANTFLSWFGDVVTLGNFYFFIIISKNIRRLLKKFFENIFNRENYSYTRTQFSQNKSSNTNVLNTS